MAENEKVEIGEAKGRPMLHWVGKRPLDYVTAYPAQTVETFNPTGEENGAQGLLFHGDNKDALAWLLTHGYRGKVDLVYIDPPFDSGADYVRKVELRGVSTAKIEGTAHSLGEQIQYTDIWANDLYLQFMYERLLLLRELLRDGGSMLLHCDYRKSHHLRCVLDEVFGQEGFVNEVIWRSTTFTGSSKAIAQRYPTNHNTIYWYHRGDNYIFNKVYQEHKEEYYTGN
jgi:adenine specific DNA methylase Mod